jgi:hypothetical protein
MFLEVLDIPERSLAVVVLHTLAQLSLNLFTITHLIQLLLLRLQINRPLLVATLVNDPLRNLPRMILCRVLALQHLIVIFCDSHGESSRLCGRRSGQ